VLNGEQLPLFIQEQKIPFSKLQAVLKEHEHIILVGDPGTGKSGALAKMTIDLFRKGYKLLTRDSSKNQQKVEIPILVTAKDVVQADDVESILDNYFPSQAIRERFTIQVLMVDALDEIPSLCRNEVIEKAEAFSEKLSCSLIITSRKIDIVKTSPEGFKKVELLPFEFGQACTLLERVLAEPQKLAAIRDELERIQFQLPLIPLSLMLIVELVEQNKEIPASVTEIYDRFHDIALGRWDQEKGIEVLFEYYIKKFFLASLAYHEFLSKGRLEIEREEFEKAYEHYAKQYTWDTEKLEGFIKEIERAGILDIKTTVTFRHRSFLDYFAAVYIFQRQDEFENLNDFLVKIYFDDNWEETVFFYVGLKREINRLLLEKILTFESETLSSYVDKFLCGKLLQAGWHSTTDLKSFGIEQASTFAPIIRDKFLNFIEKTERKGQKLLSFPEIAPEKRGTKIPKIFADIFVLMFSELSFKSMVLFNEVKSLFDTLLNESSKNPR